MEEELYKTLYKVGLEAINQLTNSEDEALHVKGLHCKYVTDICSKIKQNDRLATLCGLFHDYGRVYQHKLFSGFLDKELSHNYIGAAKFDQALIDNNIDTSNEICAKWTNIIRDVILYHGKVDFFNIRLVDSSKEYVELVSIADDMENSCRSVLYYFEREVICDKKNYHKNNPIVDQMSVSKDVLEHLDGLKKFNVVKYCNTYAEHLIFFIILLIQACMYTSIAKDMIRQPVSNYTSAIDGYKYLINTYISDKTIKDKCLGLIEKYC